MHHEYATNTSQQMLHFNNKIIYWIQIDFFTAKLYRYVVQVTKVQINCLRLVHHFQPYYNDDNDIYSFHIHLFRLFSKKIVKKK